MTLQKAIEILTIQSSSFAARNNPNHFNALKLGIEALKRVEAYKKAHVGLHYEPMPGETEE